MSVQLITENAELRRSNAKLAASLDLATTILKSCAPELAAEQIKLLTDPAACLAEHDEEVVREYKRTIAMLKRQVTYLDNTVGKYRDK